MKGAAGTKATEIKCPACNGTGYPMVMQPVQPGRKIYPAKCKKCGGKGRIAEAANSFDLSRFCVGGLFHFGLSGRSDRANP